MGRPTKLDEATAKAILAALSVGTPIGGACRAAGIGATTYKAWMTRGRSDDPADTSFRAFRSSVKKARASAQVHALTMIQSAMPAHWQAAAWYLERTDPKRWGRKPVPIEPPKPETHFTLNVITGTTVDPARRYPPPSPMRPDLAARGEDARRADPVAIGSTGANGRP